MLLNSTAPTPSNTTNNLASVKSTAPTQFSKIILRIHLFIRIISFLFYCMLH
jgi:hypothetical protein